MRIEDEVDQILRYLDELKVAYAAELKNAQKGTLCVSKDRKYTRYIQLIRESDGWRRKSITRMPDRIKNLSRAAYLRAAIGSINTNRQLMRALRGKMKSLDEDAILRLLPQSYAAIPREYFTTMNGTNVFCPEPVTDGSLVPKPVSLTTDGLSPIDWGRLPYAANPSFPETKRNPVSNGLLVRSKSEALFAEYYLRHRFCYHYDETLSFGGRYFSPDFILARGDGRLVFHEHFGRTNDPVYNRRNLEKIEYYANAGIVPWENLILTYERENGGINYTLFEAEVRAKLYG